MKKAMTILLIMVLAVAMLGCGKKNTEVSETETKTEGQSTDKNEDVKKEDLPDATESPDEEVDIKEEETKQPEESPDQPAQTPAVEVDVYYTNDEATALISEKVQIGELTPQALINELINKGMVSSDVTVLSFNKSEQEGEQVLDLDLSKEFMDNINSQGSTGERMTVGSVCNTFLKAYGSSKIKITAAGEELSTGHAEYPGYMGMFE